MHHRSCAAAASSLSPNPSIHDVAREVEPPAKRTPSREPAGNRARLALSRTDEVIVQAVIIRAGAAAAFGAPVGLSVAQGADGGAAAEVRRRAHRRERK